MATPAPLAVNATAGSSTHLIVALPPPSDLPVHSLLDPATSSLSVQGFIRQLALHPGDRLALRPGDELALRSGDLMSIGDSQTRLALLAVDNGGAVNPARNSLSIQGHVRQLALKPGDTLALKDGDVMVVRGDRGNLGLEASEASLEMDGDAY